MIASIYAVAYLIVMSHLKYRL